MMSQSEDASIVAGMAVIGKEASFSLLETILDRLIRLIKVAG